MDQGLGSNQDAIAETEVRGGDGNGSDCTAGSPYHYAPPMHVGWTCYHCGETFTTWGSAQDHFGKTPDKVAGCIIQAGDPRGLLMELRKREKDVEHFTRRARVAEGELAEFKRVTGCQNSHEVRIWFDYVSGQLGLIEAMLEKAIHKRTTPAPGDINLPSTSKDLL